MQETAQNTQHYLVSQYFYLYIRSYVQTSNAYNFRR